MKVLAILIILVALVIVVVPQFTNCEYGKDNAATKTMTISGATPTSSGMSSAMGGAAVAAALPYRMMKCYWSAHAEIVAGVPLIAIGVLLFFARRKETTRALGIITAIIGVLTILIPTSIFGTCANEQMVCNTEMKPALLIAVGMTVALGIAALVMGEMKRGSGGDATPA